MKVLQIENRQRAKALNTRFFRSVLRHVLEELLELDVYQVAIHLVSAKEMTRINEGFLAHDGSTDVITFDYSQGYEESGETNGGLAGEIFISVEDAMKQAREFKTKWHHEVTRYAVHGFLHLLGYNDLERSNRQEMKAKENALMKRVEAEFELSHLAR